MEIELRVLGPLEVGRVGGSAEAVRGLGARLLLAMVVAGGRPVRDDDLLEQAWPAGPPQHAIASVRNQVARLRRSLGPSLIQRSAGGYRLYFDACRLDLDQLTAAVCAARTLADDPAAAARLVDEALSSVRGRPFDDVADELWAMPAAAAAAEQVASAEELWGQLVIASDGAAEAITRLRDATTAHPQRELRWRQLVTALAASGRRTEGLREIGRARRALAEYGLLLGPDLLALERELVGSHGTPADGRRVPIRRDPMVGRDAELTVLARATSVVWIESEPGAGKTRLLAELADRDAEREGANLLYVSCPDGADVGARLLALLVAATDGSDDDLAGWLRRKASTNDVSVVVDDAHRLDEHAVGVLGDLIGRTTGDVRWVVATRPSDGPVARMRDDLVGGAGVVRLRRLTIDDVQELIVALAPDLGADRRRALADEADAIAGGHAHLVAELVAHRLHDGDTDDVPPRVDQLVAEWTAALPASQRELVDLLAIAGRPCPVAVVARTLGRGRAELLEMARELEDGGLVDPVTGGELDLRAALVRRALLRRLSPAAQLDLRHRLLGELGCDGRLVVAHAEQILGCGDLLDDDLADDRDLAVAAAIDRLADDARYADARAMADRYLGVVGGTLGPYGLAARLKAATALIATSDVSRGRALLAELIGQARALDDRMVLADAILAMGPLTTGLREREEVIRDAERLADSLPPAEGRRRVQLACWAAHHRINRGEGVGAAYLLLRAEEAAVTAPGLRGLILGVRAQSCLLIGDGPGPARRALDELRAHAGESGDVSAVVAALLLGSRQAWVDGTIADVRRMREAIAEAATQMPRPDLRWWPTALDAAIELAVGHSEAAATAIEAAARAGRQLGVEVAGSTALAQQLLLLIVTGQWETTAPAFEGLASAEQASPSLISAYGLACAESGRLDAAVDAARRLASDPLLLVRAGMTWGQVAMCASEVAFAVADRDLAELLWRSLEPYVGTGLALPGAGYFGTVDRCLGLLAATLGDHDRASSLCAAACVQERRRGATLWEERAVGNLDAVRAARTR